ncbi:hypothetical protein FQN52_002516 [Onygenales sp. PD_12]|nr:hypothetical protein FQN52_002516 [Onygenales sp. PD_12]
MAEAFAIAASTISVIDVAVRASSAVIRLASKISNASVEAQRVCDLIGGLEETLKQIKDVISPLWTVSGRQQDKGQIDVQLQNTLQACNADLDRLRRLLDNTTEQPKSPRLSRFKGKIKFVSKEKDIRSVLEQILGHKTSLLLVLELVGRKNDRHMIHRLEDIQQTSQFSAGDDIATIRKQLDSLAPLVRDSATREALRENQIRALTNMLEGFETNIYRCDHTVSTAIWGSAVDASNSISAIFSFIEELYSTCSASLRTNPRAREYLKWLEDEFKELLADAQQVSAVELRNKNCQHRRKTSTAHRWYAMESFNLEICKLLIQQGTNPLDCDRYGNSAISIFIELIYSQNDWDTRRREKLDSLFDLLLLCCGVDIHPTLAYIHSPGNNRRLSLPILHLAIAYTPDAELRVINPLKSILRHNYDIEEQDGYGRPALLASVRVVHRDYFPEIAHMLLDAGANPYAVDNWGNGILAYIMYTMSRCDDACMPNNIFRSWKGVLVRLLAIGCNPNSRNLCGYTPSDWALNSPTSWVLLCEAVESANLDMRLILEQDDGYKKVQHSPRTLDNMHRKVRNLKPPTLIIHDTNTGANDVVAPVCVHCNRPDHSLIARVPFDRCRFYLYRGDGFTCHLSAIHHSDGSFCKYNELETAFCTHPVYQRHIAPSTKSWRVLSRRKHVAYRLWKGPVFKSTEGYRSCPNPHRHDPKQKESSERLWKSLSWRKHVAYRLWKDGVFTSPAEAYIWATGSAPEWENIPGDGDEVEPTK